VAKTIDVKQVYNTGSESDTLNTGPNPDRYTEQPVQILSGLGILKLVSKRIQGKWITF
jgi:hypothetical protein